MTEKRKQKTKRVKITSPIKFEKHASNTNDLENIEKETRNKLTSKRTDNGHEITEYKIFCQAVQSFAKIAVDLSIKDGLRKKYKQKKVWLLNTNGQSEFDRVSLILEGQRINFPCLAHFSKKHKILSDALYNGNWSTFFTNKMNDELERITSASFYPIDAEERYAIGELELLGVVWALEFFRKDI